LLLLAGALLTFFVAGVAITLERGFDEAARAGVRSSGMGVVYGLLAVAELETDGTLTIARLPEPRLGQVGSGLYAQVVDQTGVARWRSPSAAVESPDRVAPPAPGESRFVLLPDEALFRLSYGVLWEGQGGEETQLILEVFQDSELYQQTVADFRHTLWLWLAGLGVLLLVVQTAVLRWGLSPLRDLARAVARVEQGGQDEVTGRYPLELARLADNLNRLIRSDRARYERQRNALGDLSHSIKTPLSVLGGAVQQESGAVLAETVREQIARMDAIVQHQLRRASAGGRGIGRRVAVAPATARVVAALATVYEEKHVLCDQKVASDLSFPEFRLTVDDDGPGIPADKRGSIGDRGVRLDELRPGSGIGLAMVKEIVKAYRGDVEIADSALGGAKVVLTINLVGEP